ncbi:potassium channel tetramerization domain containing 3 [Aphelenchoides avenae]|nr:potassium channel tetramerization domain containing 3 [Aphelenchus avenae]
MLSGRISSVDDETGAIFIDRDPDLFRRILNYLRTNKIDLQNVDLSTLKHEAQYYGVGPLVKRLTLCEEMDDSPCGDVLFHAYLQPPIPPCPVSNVRSDAQRGSHVRSCSATAESSHHSTSESPSNSTGSSTSSIPSKFKVPAHSLAHPSSNSSSGGSGTSARSSDSAKAPSASARECTSPPSSLRTHTKNSSCDLTRQLRSEMAILMKQQSLRAEPLTDSLRVRILRVHHNAIAAAYYDFFCCYRLKDNFGWQPIYTSPRMESPIRHMSLISKFGSQGSEKLVAVALADNTVHLWSVDDNNDAQLSRKLGKFSLTAQIDKLFFIGAQLVALSKSGKVGIWHSMTQNWQVQDVMQISCYDTAGSVLLLGCTNGSINIIDMQKFPLRMKDNDLLITELYRDPNADVITAISVYLTPKTNLCGNWIEIAYGTNTGCVRVIVQHPETVGHGPQLFQTYTVHTAPITRVALTTSHLISAGRDSLASFKVLTLDSTDDSLNSEGCDPGPYGDQDGEQIFVQRIVPESNMLFIRLASNGERICTIRAVDGTVISSFFVHECEGSNRMGARPRRYLYTGTENGSIQIWDLTTAMDQHNSRVQMFNAFAQSSVGTADKAAAAVAASAGPSAAPPSPPVTAISGMNLGLPNLRTNQRFFSTLQGPTPEELLQLIDECDVCSASLNTTPSLTPHASTPNLRELEHHAMALTPRKE